MTNATTTLAPIQVRRNADIFDIDGGWFQARWHFSFDQYWDPENMGIGQLRVFNHDTLVPGAIWPMHPHRDVEGITYVVSGEFEHRDTGGGGGTLYPGAVQRLTLGSGLQHSEGNHSESAPMQFIQMWILPAERGLPPSLEQKQYTEADRRNRLLQIIRPAGTDGEGVTVHQDANMFVSKLDGGVSVSHTIPERHAGYFYLIQGRARLNGQELHSGDAAKIVAPGRVEVEGLEPGADFLLVDTTL
jgi:redox-sensitive bicupin YhaK (pirin superfamily)